MAKTVKTKHKGVRYREHPTRKHGVRKDRYYYIRYKRDGKDVEEGLGWESEWKRSDPNAGSLEQEAINRLAELQKNKRTGTGPVTLREKRKAAIVESQKEAARLKAELAAQTTLAEYWKKTYFPAAQRSKKECSWNKEELHFRLWIGPLLGAIPLRDIKLEQWDELVKTLSTAGKSQRTKEYVTGTLRRIMKHAYERRLVPEAPPTGKRIGVPGPGNNRRRGVIKDHEEIAILEYLREADPHAWRITRFAFLTGCRASEAFLLKWVHVDDQEITFVDRKNKDALTIPFTQPLGALFESIPRGTPDEYVFKKANGTPFRQAPAAFETAVEKLGLNEGRDPRDRIVFHSIRHTVATRLAKTLTVRDLMETMGWRTSQMAIRYVHGNEAAKKKALSMLGGVPEVDNVLRFDRTAK